VNRIEVFHWPTDYPDLQPAEGTGMPYETGWYYWYCQPGCLPDSDPIGPFESEEAAFADWQENESDW
jgi:hypothetical protein